MNLGFPSSFSLLAVWFMPSKKARKTRSEATSFPEPRILYTGNESCRKWPKSTCEVSLYVSPPSQSQLVPLRPLRPNPLSRPPPLLPRAPLRHLKRQWSNNLALPLNHHQQRPLTSPLMINCPSLTPLCRRRRPRRRNLYHPLNQWNRGNQIGLC